jgi:hypothetical protein
MNWASTEQHSAKYVINTAVLRTSSERDWRFVSEGSEGKSIIAGPSKIISYRANTALSVYRQVSVFVVGSGDLLFQQLVKQWRKERGVTSSPVQMAMCPAYQQIIGMGKDAIPLILRQIENEGDDPDHWFWALRALTNANPIKDSDRGNMKRMADAWIDWGRRNYYAW